MENKKIKIQTIAVETQVARASTYPAREQLPFSQMSHQVTAVLERTAALRFKTVGCVTIELVAICVPVTMDTEVMVQVAQVKNGNFPSIKALSFLSVLRVW